MPRKACLAVVTLLLACGRSSSAMTLKEFLKFSAEEQGTYIGAAIGMLSYSYAATGNVTKAGCIKRWYFGDRKGATAPGVREISIEVGMASKLDAEKYQIEGVIMGVTDKACGTDSARPVGSRP